MDFISVVECAPPQALSHQQRKHVLEIEIVDKMLHVRKNLKIEFQNKL